MKNDMHITLTILIAALIAAAAAIVSGGKGPGDLAAAATDFTTASAGR